MANPQIPSWLKLWLLALLSVGISSCTKNSSFSTKGAVQNNKNIGKKSPLDPGKINPQLDYGDSGSAPSPIIVFKPDSKLSTLTREITQEAQDFVWLVTVNGDVFRYDFKGGNIAEKKKWYGAVAKNNEGGARTYVLEGGALLVGRVGGFIYFIDHKTSKITNINLKDIIERKYPGFGSMVTDRVCLVSYRLDQQRFVGMGFGNGQFIEIPQANQSPYEPLWNEATLFKSTIPTAKWGYSCFIDQQNKIYYGKYAGSSLVAYDLRKKKVVSAVTSAKNGGFKEGYSGLTPAFGVQASGGSYGLSGSPDGSVYNSNTVYTSVYEPKSKIVWVTSADRTKIYLIPASCLSSDAVNCSAMVKVVDQAAQGIGPMSPIGNGLVVGYSRSSSPTFKAYLMKLKDPKDIQAGIEMTVFDDNIPGDPYMYTDFTGATLYVTQSQQTFDVGAFGFKKESALAGVGLAWLGRTPEIKDWVDIQAEVRCYREGDANMPEYTTIPRVESAGVQTIFEAKEGSCGKGRKGIDSIDLKLTQLNGGTSLSNVLKVQLTAYEAQP